MKNPCDKYHYAKSSAKKRGYEFELSKEYFIALKDSSCFYCSSTLPAWGYGLDRINNTLGYTMSNCVPCCTDCNRIKGKALSFNEMKAVSRLLKEMRQYEQWKIH